MSTPINDGGPAFPEVFTQAPNEREGRDHIEVYSAGGMSLRDWFAGQALVGFLSGSGQIGDMARQNVARAAKWAYDQADAMLAARFADKGNGVGT